MNKLEIKTENLKQMLENVKNGVSKECFRPIFRGIYIESKENVLTLVTCDGYKMFTSSSEIVNGDEFTAVVPVFRIPKDADENTIIEVDKQFIKFDFGNEKNIYKLIEGEFVDWKQIMNKKNNFKISFNVKFLQEALKGEKGIVDLEFSDNISPMFINGRKLILPVRPKEE